MEKKKPKEIKYVEIKSPQVVFSHILNKYIPYTLNHYEIKEEKEDERRNKK